MKFIFGKPTDNPFDREEEIRTLLTLINRKQPVSVIRSRRVGKTSILLKVMYSISNPHVYMSAEDFVEGKSFDLKSFLISFSGLIIGETLKFLDPV
jgi:AAA+ ATPase superfamily predicted ATPase